MTPLPKQRQSHGRSRRRRAHHHIKQKKLVRCTTCDAWHVSHHVCLECGTYNGRQIFEVKTEEE